MNPIPSPNALQILRNKRRTRNTHQNEETEPIPKTKTTQTSFYLQCQHEHTFKGLMRRHFWQTIFVRSNVVGIKYSKQTGKVEFL